MHYVAEGKVIRFRSNANSWLQTRERRQKKVGAAEPCDLLAQIALIGRVKRGEQDDLVKDMQSVVDISTYKSPRGVK
jgi:hypothetical protein